MDVALRFRILIDVLCGAVARRAAAGAFGADGGPLGALLWTRLQRYARHFARLCAAPAPPPRPRRHPRPQHGDNTGHSDETVQKKNGCKPILPRRPAWLLAPVPEAAAAAGLLRALLADPALQRRIGEEPRLGRILRPLCRSLGLKLPAMLRLAPRARRTPRPKPEPVLPPSTDESVAKLPRRFRPPAWLRRRERLRDPPQGKSIIRSDGII
ncbi:hypothetical protein [Acidiphilium sp. C61]|jgi:hypothetical protein|uniref:hypothetical protein n=1 Tax=Acidiphilium sp. C61 TaxID=1671485 RepID=UPI001F45B464|nr:hypothetical protein [Acidiphilium sp. C61]